MSEDGAPLHWEAPVLEYDVVFNEETAAFSAAARHAMDQWGYALAGKTVPGYVGAAVEARSVDGRSTIELLAAFDVGADPENTIAHTQLFYDSPTGRMLDADILLNGEDFRFAPETAGAFDPASVIVHEGGHLFGLDHTCGKSSGMFPSCFDLPDEEVDRILGAVMAPTLSAGTLRRELLADDMAGIRSLYTVSSTAPVPKIIAYSRECPGTVAIATVAQYPAVAIVELRFRDGRTATISATRTISGLTLAEPVPAGADLLVIDPATRAYGSLIEPGYVCGEVRDAGGPDGPAPVADEGCDCSTTSGHRQNASVLGMLILVAALVTRHRRDLGAHVTRHRRGALLAVLIATLWSPSEARAFKCSRVGTDIGPSLNWPDREVPWFADSALTTDISDHALALEQLTLSYLEWENADCSDMRLPFQGEEPGLRAGFDENNISANKNVIVFLESSWPYDPGVIAVTTNAFDTRSGVIYDSDIEMNGENFNFFVADRGCDPGRNNNMDLRNTITHEVGHVLGLDHPKKDAPGAVESTMFASAPACETKKRSLSSDDAMGICAIYPTGMSVNPCYPPNGPSFAVVESDDGFSGCNAVTAGSLSLVWILVASGVVFARRRS